MLVGATNIDFLIPKYKLRACAREIGAQMKTARTKAALEGKNIYLEYDLSNREYWLNVPFEKVLDSDENPSQEKKYEYQKWSRKSLPEGIEFIDIIYNDIKTTTGTTSVLVTPFGFSNHHIVNLKNSDGQKIAIKINGFTGNLTFYDDYKDADVKLEDANY